MNDAKYQSMERSLIGTSLLLRETIPTLLELSESDFSDPKNRRVFLEIKDLHQNSQPIDASLIEHGHDYIKEYTSDPEGYVRALKDRSRVRKIVLECMSVIDMGNSGATSEQLLTELAKASVAIDTQSGITHVSDHMQDIVAHIDAIRNGTATTGLRTGLDFDKGISGFENGRMYIIAARPAMGKSAFALEIASRVASQGNPVGFMSLEMSTPSLITRMLVRDSGVNGMALREGAVDDAQMDAILQSAGRLSGLPVYFSDNSYVTVSTLRSRAMTMAQRHGIKMLIVDYLQLMTGDGKSREQDVSEASRVCKLIARELDIPVVVLAQLNRGVEMRDNKRPMMSDLRESGAIEQNADAIMMLYRPEYYEKHEYGQHDPDSWQGQPTKNICEVSIVKNRDGQTGIVRQVFFMDRMRFDNRSSAVDAVL